VSALNCIGLILSVVLWMIHQQIGAGVGMMSSAPMEKGSPEDVYLDRVQMAEGIIAFGSILSFISQLIDNSLVKTAGWGILAISFLTVAVVWSGLLGYRLPKPHVTDDDLPSTP
jgi:hypothetical protein